jgi:thiamine transporter
VPLRRIDNGKAVRNKMSKTRKLVTSAILIAMAVVLHKFPIIELPNGGEVSFGFMVPIIIIPYLFGNGWGILSALVLTFLVMIDGVSGYTFFGLVLDYVIAFLVLGCGRFFSQNVVIGGAIVIFIKFLAHVVSGILIWETAPWASVVYNGSYMLPEFIIAVIVLGILAKVKEIPWAAKS